jgi:hypothetical protein
MRREKLKQFYQPSAALQAGEVKHRKLWFVSVTCGEGIGCTRWSSSGLATHEGT